MGNLRVNFLILLFFLCLFCFNVIYLRVHCVDINANTHTKLTEQLRATQSGDKPTLHISYCTHPQKYNIHIASREVEWLVQQLKTPLSQNYNLKISPCWPDLDTYISSTNSNAMKLGPIEEWNLLGLNADIRICFRGSTKIVDYLLLNGNRSNRIGTNHSGIIKSLEIPKEVQKTWTAEGFLYWPRKINYVADRVSGARVGPMLIRVCIEAWKQESKGVEIQLETKRDSAYLGSNHVSVYYPFAVGNLGRRIKSKENIPILSRSTQMWGCCISENKNAVKETLTRRGFFDAHEERLKKNKGLIVYLQQNCATNPEVMFRESFIYSFVYATNRSVSLLGRCPTGHNATEKAGLTMAERKRLLKLNNGRSTVGIFSEFKFVLAFENNPMDGYFTEKILNAYLARSIPIVFGIGKKAKQSLLQNFNPSALVYCDLPMEAREIWKHEFRIGFEHCKLVENEKDRGTCRFEKVLSFSARMQPFWKPCINEIMAIDHNNSYYEKTIQEPLLPNGGQLSGMWNMTHLAAVISHVYEVVVKGSHIYQYSGSSWSLHNFSLTED